MLSVFVYTKSRLLYNKIELCYIIKVTSKQHTIMIKTLRDRFADDVDYFTDFELAYLIGYERIPMDQLCESETLWKLRSWGKYENYLDAAEEIFGEADNCNIFTEEFYEQDLVDQMDQAKEMLQRAGYPILLTEDYDIWVKRTDWK